MPRPPCAKKARGLGAFQRAPRYPYSSGPAIGQPKPAPQAPGLSLAPASRPLALRPPGPPAPRRAPRSETR